MTHDYCTCGADRVSCIDCAEAEIERLTAQLTKTEKALKDTIRIHLVDDDEWDVEEKTMKIFTRIMKEVE